MRASYIALAVFSIIPALILIFFLPPETHPNMVTDLAWITFFLLILNFALSITLLFIEGKFKRAEEKYKQKS
ncbi:MAG: hypothetical protein FGF52_03695 [Candidatus Brockarchaeota archaeon]|nr:hypothetical protein [Candidatus Brockarchaeota archaeon]